MALWRAAGLSLSLLAATAVAQDESFNDPRTTETSFTVTISDKATPSDAYQSFASQISLGTSLGEIPGLETSLAVGNATITGNGTQSTVQTTDTVTYLTGSLQTTATLSGNFSSATFSAPTPSVTNTRPCNNHPEFCTRKYSNITHIACHNSPFITPNNVAANQEYDVTYQLNDGVRFLQAQIQWPAGGSEPHFCHTSCDILDAGPITYWLSMVANWVASHPYDVVTILLGNGNYSKPELYVPYIEQSGILRHIYTPPVVPMRLEDWPTLGEMILQGRRVIMFLDYMADQTKYPWLLDEFSQLWETPFDPTNQSFPCTVQRPPDLAEDAAKDRLYLLNHNLNIELNLLGNSMLVPARVELNRTNSVEGFGSLGTGAEGCKTMWSRPPNFLNVDYYNYGNRPGSVFEVAAKMNNVTYNRPCCGPDVKLAGAFSISPWSSCRASVPVATFAALWSLFY